MRYLFLLNPAAGKQDCTVQLIPQIRAAAARAGWSAADYTIHTTEYAGHARELARAAAQEAAQAGDSLRIWTAGGDGTFMEAMTGVQGFANAAVGCLPYGSGNDFLRTYGTRAEFTDLDAQLAGGEVTIDTMQTNLGLSATICAAGLDAQVAYGIILGVAVFVFRSFSPYETPMCFSLLIVDAIPEWLDLISHRIERIRFMKKEEQRLAQSSDTE